MLLTYSFLSVALEVSFIFIEWSIPFQYSIYFHFHKSVRYVEDTRGDIIPISMRYGAGLSSYLGISILQLLPILPPRNLTYLYRIYVRRQK